MTKKENNPNNVKVTAFTLYPADIEHLQAMSQGNMSFTVRKLIEDAWKEQSAKETK